MASMNESRKGSGVMRVTASSVLWLLIFTRVTYISKGFVSSPVRSRVVAPTFKPSSVATTVLSSSDVDADADGEPATPRRPTGYVPPERQTDNTTVRKAPEPKIGDVVRYYDLDGGDATGQTLVGKIVSIQSTTSGGGSGWLSDIVELDDVGDGYYAEYSYRERRNRRALRDLSELAPLPASYVRSQDAYRVPTKKDGTPAPSHESYRLEGYEGPTAGTAVDEEVVRRDGERYDDLKDSLLSDAALAGVAGALLVQLFRGTSDAVVYAAGAAAGVGYLFFLSVKVDTVGTPDAKFGKNVSNLRFLLPVLVLAAVGLANRTSDGGNGGVAIDAGNFRFVSTDQFASAMAGFLTYRLPLFLRQLQPVISESAADLLPGSAGVALRALSDDPRETTGGLSDDLDAPGLTTVLLVSGPPGTGKTTLVDRLATDGATFELMLNRGEFLETDATGRYGLTADALRRRPDDDKSENDGESGRPAAVTVIDASVELSKRVAACAGLRIVGVWVGLDSMEKCETRVRSQIEEGTITVPPDEIEAGVVRAKIRQAIKDIEYGVVSGVFEFTILNDDVEESVKSLQDAAEYCFK